MSIGIAAFAGAFGAGMLSFLSPCVLPLVPGYLSFMTGFTPAELAEGDRDLWPVLAPSLLFVLGFTMTFVALGASASLLGAALNRYREPLTLIAGGLVILLGFFMLGVVKVPWLYGEARMDMSRSRNFGRGAALVLGIAFGFGWTPCVGPILGSILMLAGSSGSVAAGSALLLVYSLGLGLPFVLVGVFFRRLRPLVRWMSRHAVGVNRFAGVLLMALGALIVTGRLAVVSAWFTRLVPFALG
jgi:cytochrome c-type biogenesis protein